MINTIIWNTRGINTQGAMERIQSLKIIHQLAMIVILEPYSTNSQLQHCRIQLGMEKVMCNRNGKIWVFWNHEVDCTMLENDKQQLTCEIQHTQIPHKFFSIVVYAKCRDHLIRPLWERMLQLSDKFKGFPWCV